MDDEYRSAKYNDVRSGMDINEKVQRENNSNGNGLHDSQGRTGSPVLDLIMKEEGKRNKKRCAQLY